MTYGDSPSETRSIPPAMRRRSLSDGCNLKLMAATVEEKPLISLALGQEIDVSLKPGNIDLTPTMQKRSKSENFIRTAQGILFTGAKSQAKRTRLESLVELAANPGTSRSNALLAKKALRYHKVQECRRLYN